MDYRKPVVFGENWSESRYQVLPYFAHEKAALSRPDVERILDVGCAAGWNMSRFVQYGQRPFGLDIAPERVKLAQAHGPVMISSGLHLPVASESLDLIYIQHVLHHIGDPQQALAEVMRCLRPGGILFLVETVEDNVIIRYGRRLYPKWLGDEINAPFYFAQLKEMLTTRGFAVETAGRYSVLFWLWEILPDRWPVMEKLTPIFVQIERLLIKLLPKQAAHCYYVAIKP
jgi:SAM-dependent methyltransferase